MKRLFLALSAVALLCTGCFGEDRFGSSSSSASSNGVDGDADTTWTDDDDFSDWDDATHSKTDNPDFDEVFTPGEVKRLDITISYDNWTAMYADLKANISTSSPGWGGGGQATVDTDFDPIWVPGTVEYNGTKWYKVGVRFKGNSSLTTAYSQGNYKLSMKLDFDEFEGTYPELKNQRFYGFKQLNLNNNYNDKSFMREKVAADLYREFGMPAAHVTFCEVYINYGAGSKYFGLYSIVEEVDDTLVYNQFTKGGNLYKPDGDAASWAKGTYNTDEFYPKTNKTSTDYSDMKALYDALHDDTRTTNVAEWKTNLEAVFNVDHFLKYLAVNHTIQNWDTYGNMTHNYFLYTNPDDGLVTWVPWDNNEAFSSDKNPSPIEVSALGSVSTTSWPLIPYIIQQDEYLEKYKEYLEDFTTNYFSASKMQALYDEYSTLIKSSAISEQSGYTYFSTSSNSSSSSYSTQFSSAVSTLKSHVTSRNSTVNNYLK